MRQDAEPGNLLLGQKGETFLILAVEMQPRPSHFIWTVDEHINGLKTPPVLKHVHVLKSGREGPGPFISLSKEMWETRNRSYWHVVRSHGGVSR